MICGLQCKGTREEATEASVDMQNTRRAAEAKSNKHVAWHECSTQNIPRRHEGGVSHCLRLVFDTRTSAPCKLPVSTGRCMDPSDASSKAVKLGEEPSSDSTPVHAGLDEREDTLIQSNHESHLWPLISGRHAYE